jgi:RNA polymerase sigma factor (TIGR02999 family)
MGLTSKMPDPSYSITALLNRIARGDPEAQQQFNRAVYDELRRIAERFMRRERPNHTLQPTALVHEAFFKLMDQKYVTWQNRAHFYGVAADSMRRILVDHWRKIHAQKRAGQLNRVSFDEQLAVSDEASVELLALDEALGRLRKENLRESTIVVLRFFAGLEIEEIAQMLDISSRTAKRDWLRQGVAAQRNGKIKLGGGALPQSAAEVFYHF